jgi:formamidopyrimidine-DNA glycosylase
MVPRGRARHNDVMPELPDLDVLADAFHAALAGRPVLGAAVPQPLVVRGTGVELAALPGQRLRRVEQRGKFLLLTMDRDRIVVNPMLTGRLGIAAPGTRPLASTAFTLALGPRHVAPSDAAGWTSAATWMPADEDPVELRYRDPTRMGKVYVLPDGVPRQVAGWDELGPDVDDPELDLGTWRTRITRHTGELKNLLRNQGFIAGIGNGYSDEILWEAGLAPFRKRSTLASEEIDRLWQAAREVPAWAIDQLRDRVPPRFEIEVRDFLRVHRKGGQPCPRCGTPVTEISPGGFVTSWCRSCQA